MGYDGMQNKRIVRWQASNWTSILVGPDIVSVATRSLTQLRCGTKMKWLHSLIELTI